MNDGPDPARVIALASDHAGFPLKNELARHLQGAGYTLVDLGAHDESSVDYPEYGAAMAGALADGRAARGVLVCGSGIGISIAANRFPHVRAALVHDPDETLLARQHNDANVICFGGRFMDAKTAKACVDLFLETDFEGGRHARRVGKLAAPQAPRAEGAEDAAK